MITAYLLVPRRDAGYHYSLPTTKMKNMKTIVSILLIILNLNCTAQNTIERSAAKNELEVLIIGTSHWTTYEHQGSDVAKPKEIDILSPKYQDELISLVAKIGEFNPSKIFIERTPNRQAEIDSLYNLYKTSNWGERQRNEIYQLGFRTANYLQHSRLYCIDNYDYTFPIDSVRGKADEFKQQQVLSMFADEISGFERRYNKLVNKKATLVEILKHWDSEQEKKANVGLYINVINKVGSSDNFVGSYLNSEWYKRNLNILSNIQRSIEHEDTKIMILMGAGHTALLEDFIEYIPNWKIINIKEIVE